MRRKGQISDVQSIPPEKLDELNAACDRILKRQLTKPLRNGMTFYSNPYQQESPAEIERKKWDAELLQKTQNTRIENTYSQVGHLFIKPNTGTKES